MTTPTPNWATALQENQFLEKELSLTPLDYGQAVQYVVSHALHDTSGSRAAAQVLLSLYNGHEWHMDYALLYQALLVIRGRTVLQKEPHDMIENGQNVFAEIQEKWQQLHINNRYSEV